MRQFQNCFHLHRSPHNGLSVMGSGSEGRIPNVSGPLWNLISHRGRVVMLVCWLGSRCRCAYVGGGAGLSCWIMKKVRSWAAKGVAIVVVRNEFFRFLVAISLVNNHRPTIVSHSSVAASSLPN